MRVLYLITKSMMGGAQMHILDLLRGFDAPVDPIVCAGEEGYFTAAVREMGVPCFLMPSLVHPIAPLKDMRALFEVARLIRHSGANLVHAHTSKAGVIGRLAARAAGVPSVFTAHTWCFAEGTSWKWRLAGVPAERLAGRVGDAVINVSAANHDLALRNRVCSADRMVTILNGIPDTPYRSRPDAPGVPVIVMIARCAEQKDHKLLLHVLARLDRPVRTIFVGGGPLMADLQREAAELGVAQKAQFVGDRPDIPKILARAQIFALATKWEGLPLSILEAMRAGLPVVASNVGGVSEAVVHGETGFLVESGAVNEFHAAISALLGDKQLRRRMGQKARLRYEEHFTLERMLDQTFAIYKNVLSGGAISTGAARAAKSRSRRVAAMKG